MKSVMKSIQQRIVTVLALLAVAASPVFLSTASALEPALETVKQQGAIGESIDGYLYVIGAVDPEIERKVAEVNAKRRTYYSQIAAEKNVSVAQVARVTGEANLAKQEAGVFVYDATGNWVRK